VKFLKKHFTQYKPPLAKAMGLTDDDSLISDKTKSEVELYYYEEKRFITGHSNPTEEIQYYENHSRINDGSNNPNAKFQIHNFGDSWTFGWSIEQNQSYPHLLIEDDVASYNYGAGRTGLDYSVKKISEVYDKYNHRENRNFVYVITIPHLFRRMWFDLESRGNRARRCIDKPEAALITSHNHYLYFLQHYEIVNRLVGRDRVIWGSWDMEVPEDKLDLFFQLHDHGKDGRHPGPESHQKYANNIKQIIKERKLFTNEI